MKRLWNKSIWCTEARYESIHDQITYGPGPKSVQCSSGRSRTLLQQVFTSTVYTTTAIYHSRATTIFQNRLSRYRANAPRLQRVTQGIRPQKRTRSFHAAKGRNTIAKKRAFERLLIGIFDDAQQQGRLAKRPTGAVDATGLESRHTSQHYIKRCGYKRFLRYSWPKMTTVGDLHSYLFASCIITRGPSNDSPQFRPAVLQAEQFIHFDRLLADAAYDGEHNHCLCRRQLRIRSTIIELNQRNSRKWPKSKYRRQMKTRFPRRLFVQRWHIESMFSQHKRILGSSLRSRTDASRERECYTRVLTHNLMILRRAA